MTGHRTAFYCGSKRGESHSICAGTRAGSTDCSTDRRGGRRGLSALLKAHKSPKLESFSAQIEMPICADHNRSSDGINQSPSTAVQIFAGWRLYVSLDAVFPQLAVVVSAAWGLDGAKALNLYCHDESKQLERGGHDAADGAPANGTDPCPKRPQGHRSAQVGTDHRSESVPVFPQFNAHKSALGTDGTDIYRLASRVEISGVSPGRPPRAALYGAHMRKPVHLCPIRAQRTTQLNTENDRMTEQFRQGTVPVIHAWMHRGQRWVEVGPCPWCAGVHTHTWPPAHETPGRRMAPCTSRTPGEYHLTASPELLAAEAAGARERRQHRRRRPRTAGQENSAAGGRRS